MAACLVPLVQIVVLWHIGQLRDADGQFVVLLKRSFLAAVRTELLNLNTQRDTGITTIAIGSIGKQAASSKAFGHQF